MAVNGDPANHSSASNKPVKKMKKRKELDALLSGSNGKSKHFTKPSNKPSKKDGHELLIPDESDISLDSSENEFFASPKKTIIRKPDPWRFCATCIPLCIFVLTLACIVVTTGLIWMHMELKQDMDSMRDRLTKVESDVQTSQTQAATVSSLESKLEKLQGLIINNQHALTQLKTLNQSITDLKSQVKAVKSTQQASAAAGNAIQLQQEVANLGNKVTGLEEMKDTVSHLQTQMTQVSGKVDSLESAHHPATSGPTTSLPASNMDNILIGHNPNNVDVQPNSDVNLPTSHNPNNVDSAMGEVNLRPATHGQVDGAYVHQELKKFDISLDDLNSTISTIKQYQQGLDARLTLLEAMGVVMNEPHQLPKDKSVTIPPQMMTVFTKINDDVNTLMNWYNETQLHTPTDATNPTVSSPLAHLPIDSSAFVSIEDHDHWENHVNNTLKALESKLESLSSETTSTNSNYTTVIRQSLDDFIKAYHSEMDSVKEQQQVARGDINTLTSNLLNVQQRFNWVYDKIEQLQGAHQNLSEHGMVENPTVGSILEPLPSKESSEPVTTTFPKVPSSPEAEAPSFSEAPSFPKESSLPFADETAPDVIDSHPTTERSEPTIPSTLRMLEPEPTIGKNPITRKTPTSGPISYVTTESQKERDETTTSADEQTTAEDLKGPEWQRPLDIFQPTPPATITFPNVNNIRDLQNKFSLWDKNSDGFVLYSDLPDFMGPYTPKEEALVKFDANKDGKYDLEEILHAAGYM